MKKNLWLKLISVLLILASMVTLVACSAVEEVGGSDSASDSGTASVNGGPRAEDFPPSANLTFEANSKKTAYQLKSASKCKDEVVVIPAYYTGTDGVALPVTSIMSGAFKDNKTAVTVYIPDTVTKIAGGDDKKGTVGAFSGAEALTTVICGKGLTEIGAKAFEDCGKLKDIELKEGITLIAAYAFAGCKSLESIVIPDTVTQIGTACFQRCLGLRSVTLGKKVKSLGKYCFYYCNNIASVNYMGTKSDWSKLKVDVSCFISLTITRVVQCSDGTCDLPNIR